MDDEDLARIMVEAFIEDIPSQIETLRNHKVAQRVSQEKKHSYLRNNDPFFAWL